MNVFFHVNEGRGTSWDNNMVNVETLPRVGEYIVLGAEGRAYKVEVVIHTPSSDAECVAEVFAISDGRLFSEIIPEYPLPKTSILDVL